MQHPLHHRNLSEARRRRFDGCRLSMLLSLAVLLALLTPFIELPFNSVRVFPIDSSTNIELGWRYNLPVFTVDMVCRINHDGRVVESLRIRGFDIPEDVAANLRGVTLVDRVVRIEVADLARFEGRQQVWELYSRQLPFDRVAVRER